DGLALPAVLMFLALSAGQTERSTFDWIQFSIGQVTIGPLAGIVVGFVGGKLLLWGKRTGWMNQAFQDLSPLGLSLLAYAAANLVGGNGFIAAFCAGLTLGNSARSVCKCIYEFAEAEGQLLTLLVFMVFGAITLPETLRAFHPIHLLYAIASLTVIRILPVAISLVGVHLRPSTKLFLGWFGPRGIASILYALLLVEASDVPNRETLLSVISITVLMSIFLHGLSAIPGVTAYARALSPLGSESGEHVPVAEMPTRVSKTTDRTAKPQTLWDVGFERVPEIRFSDDERSVEIRGFRNFRYHCEDAQDSHEACWETRRFDLDQVCDVDFIVVPFNDHPHLAHTMVSFGLSGGDHLTISVEARRPHQQAYSLAKGMFGYFPLIYVIADERDCIGVRMECRKNTVHLYPSTATPAQARLFLRSMLRRAQQLETSPERYNTLWNNCLTNLRDHVNEVWPGRVRWSWRTVVSGHAAYLAYELGLLDRSESFQSLNEKARINELADGNWHRDDFSR
ncbi:MAG: DUF4105 domain-containing protein, partial [Planctomycetota bacterium]